MQAKNKKDVNKKVTANRTGKCQTMVFSRITGYYSAHTDFNKGKLAEFSERKHFNVGGEDETKTGGDNVSRP